MWGTVLAVFIALNFVSTFIILAACVVSGRNRGYEPEVVRTDASEQLELAVAISRLQRIELCPVSV